MKKKVSKKKENEKKEKKKISLLIKAALILVVIIVVVASIYFVLQQRRTLAPPYESQSRSDRVGEVIENSTSIGWIQVEGTNIDYPIVYMTPRVYQSVKNYSWIKHRPTEEENRLVIFGHNIKNISSKPLLTEETHARFEQLMSFVYYDFAKDNEYITYTNEDGIDEIYKIFAISFQDEGDEEENAIPKEEVSSYIKKSLEDSIYDYDIEVNDTDTILSLITCTRYFGENEKTQFRIDARKLRENETTEKYIVNKTKNYDIIG